MFKNFVIRKINKLQCKSILQEYHYLSKINKGFRSGHNFGLFNGEVLVGVCIFHSPSVPETVKGCFGLKRNEQHNIFELGRLCILPSVGVLAWLGICNLAMPLRLRHHINPYISTHSHVLLQALRCFAQVV